MAGTLDEGQVIVKLHMSVLQGLALKSGTLDELFLEISVILKLSAGLQSLSNSSQ